MKYTLRSVVPNTKILHKTGNYLCYVTGNKLCVNGKIFDIDPSVYNIDNNADVIWIKDEQWNNYSIDIKKGEIANHEFHLLPGGKLQDGKILIHRDGFRIYTHPTHTISQFVFTVEAVKYYIFHKGSVILQEAKRLLSYPESSASKQWELDLDIHIDEDDSVAKFFEIEDGLLWLISRKSIIIGIATDTGKLIHRLSPKIKGYHPGFADGVIDVKGRKLVGISQKHYWEIDLTNPEDEMAVYDLVSPNKEYFANRWANPQAMVLDENYIYCRDIELSIVMIINRKTRQIEWYNKINDLPPRPPDVINAMQVTATHFYVTDSAGRLFIWEKELP